MIRLLPRRHRAASTTVVLLVLLLLAAAVAEFAAQGLLRSRLSAAVGRMLDGDSDVRVEGGPALLDLYDRHLDAVTVTSDGATLGRLPDVAVRARLDDIRLTGGTSATVARTEVEVAVPARSLAGLAAGEGGSLPVSGVTLDAAADTVTLTLGARGLGHATLRPTVQDGRLTWRLEQAEFLGSPAPARVVDRIRSELAGRSGPAYPLGLRATGVDVTSTALDVTLTGGRTRLPARQDTG